MLRIIVPIGGVGSGLRTLSETGPENASGRAQDDARSLLAAITASSNDAIVGKDLSGIVTYWNDAAESLFGFTAAEMIGQSITKVIPPSRIHEESAILERVGRGERLKHFETDRLTKDGAVIPVSLTISPIRDALGTIIGVSKIARGFGEIQQLNQDLRQREALLRSILDTVPDALIVIDHRGIVRSFSPAAERMFGYSAAEVAGCNVSLLMPSAQAATHDSRIERYLSTGERRIIGIGRVVVGQRKDGRTFPMELQIGEVHVPGAHLFTGFVRDLTERHARERRVTELQAELIHVSRLSELGQMVSALAHEVSQPLTAIANYLRGIRRLVTDDTQPALRQAIERVIEQSERARDIVQSLRSLVRKETRARQVEDLETMVQETSVLALIGAQRPVRLDVRIAPDAAHAFVDKVQIQQVLLNLMRNAVEAMAASPVACLTVSTARRDSRIVVEIADTGPGIAQDVQARLFQPFVTSKSDGLGVGLSICRTIVEGHGGELIAESPSGEGTIFRFTVPAPETARAVEP
jgi:two-component system sensor kinase FixL